MKKSTCIRYLVEERYGLCYTEHETEMACMTDCNDCCSRHQQNKPTKEDLRNMFDGEYEFNNKNVEHDCKCYCRSNARQICRNNYNCYKKFEELINSTTISQGDEIMPGRNFKKTQFYEENLPYVRYNRMRDSERMANGDYISWIYYYYYLVRIDGVVYDICIEHSFYDDDYIESLGDDIEQENIFTIGQAVILETK